MNRFNSGARLLISVSVAAMLTVPAYAQSNADEANPPDDGTIIVTAQKRAEDVQDVPIAVSAFSADALEARGLNGGPDLQIAIPNVSFTDTGVGRFNFQIRGIGAQIQGPAADTGVGIHQNNIPLTVSRLASAEFFDIERVEVLRGPQGTLYGRNATGGVVNMITARPDDDFSGEVSAEYGRFDRMKLSGYVNVPLSDTFAVRVAGVHLSRDGDTLNAGTGNMVNSRDLWSTRISASFEPTDTFRATAMWQHFEEDDTSGANGKTICAPDPGPATIGGVTTNSFTRAALSGGCLQNSAEDPSNNGVPNSLKTLPGLFGYVLGTLPFDAFAGRTVSTDLHTVQTISDPSRRANNDLISLELELDLGDALTITSLSAYTTDHFRSQASTFGGLPTAGFLNTPLTPGGSFTDPQLGTSRSLDVGSIVRQDAKQFSQELRVQSDFNGPINFSVGGIYLDYSLDEDVIVMANTTTMAAAAFNFGGAGIYIDPLAEPDGTGHNYYNAANPYDLRSGALFGEAYFQATDTLKATLGLRYTNDHKVQETNPIALLAPGRGFPSPVVQTVNFEEITGRATVDWQPEVTFTDSTLLYASYSRGYKGGGFNPGGGASAGFSPTFDPELVNAFELGTKNTLADGRVVFNLTGFYYDYTGYQIARAANQTVFNENVDARVQGLEFEAGFEPVDGLRFDTQIGYLDTEIRNGSSINLNDRTQGDVTLATVRSIDPGSFATSCVLPVAVLADVQGGINAGAIPNEAMSSLCTGPFAVPGASAGVPVNLEGNQLPNAPHWTLAFGAEYQTELGSDWTATLRGDFFRQTASFGQIFNTTYDRIEGYNNLNLSLRIEAEELDLEILGFARNLLDQDAITNIQINSTETGGSRTVFGKERASYGIAITKRF